MNQTYANQFLGEMGPAGQRAAQALSPYQQFRVSGSVYPPPSTGGQGYGVADPVAAFEQLDPADDGFLEKQTAIFQGADPQIFRSPSIQNRIRQANAAHAEAQTYFKEDPSLVDFYIEQRNKNIAPQVAIGELRKRAQDSALKGAALKSGLLLDEYEALRDPTSGTVDRFKLQDFANRREREIATRKAAERDMPKDVTAEAYNRLLNYKDAAEAAAALKSDEGKIAAYIKKYPKVKPPTAKAPWDEAKWTEAYHLVDQEQKEAEAKYKNARRAYASQYKLPNDFDDARAPQATAPVVEEKPVPAPFGQGEPAATPSVPVAPPVAAGDIRQGPGGTADKDGFTPSQPAPVVGTPAVAPALPEATTPPIEQTPAGTGPATEDFTPEQRAAWYENGGKALGERIKADGYLSNVHLAPDQVRKFLDAGHGDRELMKELLVWGVAVNDPGIRDVVTPEQKAEITEYLKSTLPAAKPNPSVPAPAKTPASTSAGPAKESATDFIKRNVKR